MSSFSEKEIAYIRSQRLGRLATLSADGSPHQTVVAFYYNAELDTIDIGGRNMGQSKKYRDVARDGRVAFIIDDVDTSKGWQPHGIEIRGTAEAIAAGGQDVPIGKDGEKISYLAAEFIRIHPTHIVSWGVEHEGYAMVSRKVKVEV